MNGATALEAISQQHPLFPGGRLIRAEREGVAVRAMHYPHHARKSALLLLHGHPQTMSMWHLVAPHLLTRHSLVLMDLRGYGDSDRPPAGADDVAYSKRQMALDALGLMRALGYEQFDVLAHDRGARVAHRLAQDHPGAVRRLMLLDVAPTLAMYEQTTQAFARAYWHWFFLIQPNGLPEALIDADPVRYLRASMGSRRADGLTVFDRQALMEYERCIAIPGSGRGISADYRASAGLDLAQDRADVELGLKLGQPLRVLWGEHGTVGRNFDVLDLWRTRARDVSGRGLACSHYLAEECPAEVIAEAQQFFTDSSST